MVNKTLADSLYGDIFHLPGARWVWGTNTTLCPSSWWFNGHLAYSSNAEKELKTQWFFARTILEEAFPAGGDALWPNNIRSYL